MAEITLESLIEEHKSRIPKLQCKDGFYAWYEYPDMDAYYRWLENTKRFINFKYPNDKSVKEFERISNTDLEIEPDQQQKMLAILEALLTIDVVIPDESYRKNGKEKRTADKGGNIHININNSNTQSQNQQMSIAVNIFLEAIKDDLTGKQQKELKAIIEEADGDMKKAHPSLVEKLKSFGSDVSSNIVANLLTNPAIWEGFLGLF